MFSYTDCVSCAHNGANPSWPFLRNITRGKSHTTGLPLCHTSIEMASILMLLTLNLLVNMGNVLTKGSLLGIYSMGI